MSTKLQQLNQATLLKRVLSELRRLRAEMFLFLPSERLDDFQNAEEIRDSYRRAVKKHPASYISFP